MSKVYSLKPVWRSSDPLPYKFIDGLPPEKEKDVICLFHDSWHIAARHSFKGLIINVFAGPGPNDIPLFKELASKYKEKFLFTYSFAHPSRVKQESMETTVPIGHVEHLTIPGIPGVHHDVNNFDKDIILFPNRDLVSLMRANSRQLGDIYNLKSAFIWIATKLSQGSTKEFHIMSGLDQADLDFRRCADLYQEFFSYDITQCLLPFKSRIKIHKGFGWDEVLHLLSETKIMITALGTAGGTPREAAAYGIPNIGMSNDASDLFFACPRYLYAPSLSETYFDLIEKLYTDKEYYTEVGSAYRDYVDQFYTYKAFTNNLFDIFQRRNML